MAANIRTASRSDLTALRRGLDGLLALGIAGFLYASARRGQA